MKISKPLGRREISGPLDYDPELRFTPGGHPVCNLVLVAVDGSQIHAVGWDAVAEDMAERLVRGSQIAAEGSWRQQTWIDREGEKRTRDVFTIESYTVQ